MVKTKKQEEKEKFIKASSFTKEELFLINNVAKTAFSLEPRPLVLLGIVGAILSNIIIQSEGKLDKKSMIKWVNMSF